MAEEADDFDQHFGGAAPAEDGEKSDAADGDESAGLEEGESEEGSEEDEEDFSKEWGDLPDDPVKFGGGGSAVKKAIRVALMVLIGFGVPSVIVGVLYFTGTLESIQDSMNSSGEEVAAEESPDKEKKKKKRSRKKKKKKKSKSSALKSDNGGGEVNQDWEIEFGEVRVAIKGKAELWVDGVALGKVKKKKLKLSAGNHLFRAKMGKKKIAVQGTVSQGGTFLLSIDFKKMKSNFEEKSGRKRKR